MDYTVTERGSLDPSFFWLMDYKLQEWIRCPGMPYQMVLDVDQVLLEVLLELMNLHMLPMAGSRHMICGIQVFKADQIRPEVIVGLRHLASPNKKREATFAFWLLAAPAHRMFTQMGWTAARYLHCFALSTNP